MAKKQPAAKRSGAGSAFGTAGAGRGKGKMPSRAGVKRTSASSKAASNRKD